MTVEEQVRNRVVSTNYKGWETVRMALALMATEGRHEAAAFARERWPETSLIERLLASAADAVTTADGGLMPPAREFVELMAPRNAFALLQPYMRRVPFNSGATLTTAGAAFAWVGQGKPVAVSKLTFSPTPASLPRLKISGLIVASLDLVRSTAPAAETLFRDEMVRGGARATSDSFLDVANAGVANVEPASITADASPIASSGNVLTDVGAVLNGFETLDRVCLIMSERAAVALGNAAPGSIVGGRLHGIVPLIASNSAGTNLIAAHGPSIIYADDGELALDSSGNASIQMDTAPDDPATGSTVLVSLWQEGLRGLKLTRWLNWKVMDPAAVVLVGTCSYA